MLASAECLAKVLTRFHSKEIRILDLPCEEQVALLGYLVEVLRTKSGYNGGAASFLYEIASNMPRKLTARSDAKKQT